MLISKGEAHESTSAHTTGFLTTGIDTSLSDLAAMFGPDHAKAIWRSGEIAISQIEQTITSEKKECEVILLSQINN